MGKPVCLKLNGKAFAIRPAPPRIERIMAELDALPPDELFTTPEILKRLRTNLDALNSHAAQALADYRQICHGHQRYWGSRKAIAELRRQLEAAQ